MIEQYPQQFIRSQVEYYKKLLGTNLYGSHNAVLIHGLYLKYKALLK